MSGGGSRGGGNQITRTEPAAYQLPYLQTGLKNAEGLFNQGGPTQYTGNTVVPFAPQTEAALAGTEARATQGSPLTGGAQDYAQRTLAGDYLNAGNPYLDAAVNRAADKSYQTLTSQFARSGRNVNAAAPLQADILSDITSRMYGDAYDAERNRQQGVLPFVTPLAEADYRDLSALRGVGQEVEGLSGRAVDDAVGRFDFEQQRPQAALDQFLGRVTGMPPGNMQTTQMYRNRAAGAAGGALAGYQLGQGLPWWGQGLTTLGGGIFGYQ